MIARRDPGVSSSHGYRGSGTMGRVIERVYIHNYKCLVNLELRLQETVLQYLGYGRIRNRKTGAQRHSSHRSV